jgi:hypothetical protein
MGGAPCARSIQDGEVAAPNGRRLSGPALAPVCHPVRRDIPAVMPTGCHSSACLRTKGRAFSFQRDVKIPPAPEGRALPGPCVGSASTRRPPFRPPHPANSIRPGTFITISNDQPPSLAVTPSRGTADSCFRPRLTVPCHQAVYAPEPQPLCATISHAIHTWNENFIYDSPMRNVRD